MDVVDYVLFSNRQTFGVIEPKTKGTTLTEVEEQSKRYAETFPEEPYPIESPLPFVYESTGIEIYFRDRRDEESRSREVLWFHTPEELRELLDHDDTLRNQLPGLPPPENVLVTLAHPS